MGEKPLVEVKGKPMVERVLEAVSSVAETVSAAPSPHTPETRAYLDGRVPVIETPGEGYVEDLSWALESLDLPVLTLTADLPCLTPADVRSALEGYEAGSRTVCVPVARKRELDVSVGTRFEHEGRAVAPTGVNVVGAGIDSVRVVGRTGLVVNVNEPFDLKVARSVISERF